MRVKCTQIFTNRPNRTNRGNKTEHLSVGTEYLVLCIYFSNNGVLDYQIEGDAGDLIIFEADQFEVLSRHIPSNWEITIKNTKVENSNDSTYYLKLAPRRWNNASISFYEEITDVSGPLENWRHWPGIPEVVKLYLQEKDIIRDEEDKISSQKVIPLKK